MLSIHDFSNQPESTTTPFAIKAGGRDIYMAKVPLITSREMDQIEPFQVEEGYGLRCILSKHGSLLWEQAATSRRGTLMMLMANGRFRSFLRQEGMPNPAEIVLPGPFTWAEAELIASKGKKKK